jgi:chromosome segregation ATPase
MPESTRLLEISAEGVDAAAVATFAGCLATRAVEENRRLNADVARRGESQVAAALLAARTEVEKQELELTRVRIASLVELKRALLKAALSEIAAAADEERLARQHIEEEEARSTSYEESAGRRPATRETAESGASKARANAAAARAAVAVASRGRTAAEARAALLEREITSREEELVRLKRRVESTAAGLTELEKRTALAPLESASKAFDLQLVAPPPPVAPRVGPSSLLVAAVGALAAVFLGALLVLSRPE